MTWEEAKQAFRDQVPVVYHNQMITRGIIPCTRIAELTLRMTIDGRLIRVVGGMDRNENCLYHDMPEHFDRADALPDGRNQ